jgi:CxxC-x17-CxxC domain-containing protein
MKESFENSAEQRTMHKATCSDCGAECEVPFQPTEGKSVRCLDCFKKNRPSRGPRRFGGGRKNFDRRPREMHDAKCAECGKNCQVPFKPSGDKPVLCGDCYKKSKGFS